MARPRPLWRRLRPSWLRVINGEPDAALRWQHEAQRLLRPSEQSGWVPRLLEGGRARPRPAAPAPTADLAALGDLPPGYG